MKKFALFTLFFTFMISSMTALPYKSNPDFYEKSDEFNPKDRYVYSYSAIAPIDPYFYYKTDFNSRKYGTSFVLYLISTVPKGGDMIHLKSVTFLADGETKSFKLDQDDWKHSDGVTKEFGRIYLNIDEFLKNYQFLKNFSQASTAKIRFHGSSYNRTFDVPKVSQKALGGMLEAFSSVIQTIDNNLSSIEEKKKQEKIEEERKKQEAKLENTLEYLKGNIGKVREDVENNYKKFESIKQHKSSEGVLYLRSPKYNLFYAKTKPIISYYPKGLGAKDSSVVKIEKTYYYPGSLDGIGLMDIYPFMVAESALPMKKFKNIEQEKNYKEIENKEIDPLFGFDFIFKKPENFPNAKLYKVSFLINLNNEVFPLEISQDIVDPRMESSLKKYPTSFLRGVYLSKNTEESQKLVDFLLSLDESSQDIQLKFYYENKGQKYYDTKYFYYGRIIEMKKMALIWNEYFNPPIIESSSDMGSNNE